MLAPLWGLTEMSFPRLASCNASNPRTAPPLLPRSLNFLIASSAFRCSTFPGSNKDMVAFRCASLVSSGSVACEDSRHRVCTHMYLLINKALWCRYTKGWDSWVQGYICHWHNHVITGVHIFRCMWGRNLSETDAKVPFVISSIVSSMPPRPARYAACWMPQFMAALMAAVVISDGISSGVSMLKRTCRVAATRKIWPLVLLNIPVGLSISLACTGCSHLTYCNSLAVVQSTILIFLML